jgi:hypothetical protein
LIINSVSPTVTWHVCTWAMYSRVRLFMVGSLGGPVVSAASPVSVASVVVSSVVVSVVVALVSDSGDVADPIAMSSTSNPTTDAVAIAHPLRPRRHRWTASRTSSHSPQVMTDRTMCSVLRCPKKLTPRDSSIARIVSTAPLRFNSRS